MDFTQVGTTYFATPKDDPKDRVAIAIGDPDNDGFVPQLKIGRWVDDDNPDGEAWVKLTFIGIVDHNAPIPKEVRVTLAKTTMACSAVDAATKVLVDRDRISYACSDDINIALYHIDDPEGGQEFNIVLNSKPIGNQLQFALEDSGNVSYLFQPALANENEDGSRWEKKPSGIVYNQPEIGIGSYAVYRNDTPINYDTGKTYRLGKIGHLYRPQVQDANGIKVWAELNIDDGLLTVTIPQDFLDNAAYPVSNAAGLYFGYQGSQQNSSDWNGLQAVLVRSGCRYVATAGDTITSFNAYCLASATTKTAEMAAYTYTTKPVTRLAAVATVTATTSAGWRTIEVSQALTGSTEYAIAIGHAVSGFTLYTDNGASNDFAYNAVDETLPATFRSDPAYSDGILCIYAVYTAGGGAVVIMDDERGVSRGMNRGMLRGIQ
jgi:hypothetical protein